MKRNAGGIEYELTLKRIRNVNLRIISDGTVKVSAPYGTDRDFIDGFVLSRRGFIDAARAKTASKRSVPEVKERKSVVYERLYSVYSDIYSRFVEYGFKLPELRIRKMTSQWGNCRKRQGIITLNTYLYGMPLECIELVAAHELSHMVEDNHSAAFYAVLESVMPDWRARDERLKDWRLCGAGK